MAIGWDSDTIAGRLGLSDGQAVRRITRARYIFRTTADRIADLYDQLADQRGPSERARRYAATQGWPSPLWWDDDTIDDPDHNPRTQNVDDLCTADMVVVERLIDGIPPLHVTRAERIEAVRLLNSRGWSRSLIAQQLAMSGARVAQILDVLVHTEKHSHVAADLQKRVG